MSHQVTCPRCDGNRFRPADFPVGKGRDFHTVTLQIKCFTCNGRGWCWSDFIDLMSAEEFGESHAPNLAAGGAGVHCRNREQS